MKAFQRFLSHLKNKANRKEEIGGLKENSSTVDE